MMLILVNVFKTPIMFRNSVFIMAVLLVSIQLPAQNWTTHCGNNERNGRSKMPGPQNVDTPIWTVTDPMPTSLGMSIYSFGGLFVTSRVDFSPYHAIMICRDLHTGELIWTSPDLGSESILYPMGFNEDAVYAHDYYSGYFYALNPSDGSIKWVSENTSYTFAPMDGVIYTCDRDLIINGELGSWEESTVCLNRETGEVLWTNQNLYAVTPNETKASYNDHLYMITGAINQPIKLVAVDMRTGENLYYSEELPGDGDQEGPLAVGPDGTIFFCRDGGDLYAVIDNGSGFDILWTHTPISEGLHKNYVIDHGGDLLFSDNGKIYRLSGSNGNPVDSSEVADFEGARLIMGSDSVIYINNTSGKYYALSYDLGSVLWSLPVSGNGYAGPALSQDGIMVSCGAGSTIKAYAYSGEHAPVCDFIASDYQISAGATVNFTDQSSFDPTAWHWEFPGGEPAFSYEQHPAAVRYDLPGVYDVKLITQNTLGSDTLVKQCLIEVEYHVGLEEPATGMQVEIYPNPAKASVKIMTGEKTSMVVYDARGKAAFADNSYVFGREIDVSTLVTGIYLIRLTGQHQGGEAFVIQRKLLVIN